MGICQSADAEPAGYTDLQGSVKGKKISTKELQRRIGHARKTCSLKLHAAKLQSVPEEVLETNTWKLIDLAHNELVLLPPQLSECSKLRTLAVPHNNVSEVECSLSRLVALRRLDFSYNPLCVIPELPQGLLELDISGCTKLDLRALGSSLAPCADTLQTLTMKGCNLEQLPSWLSQLTNLSVLDVSGNPSLSSLELQSGSWAQLANLAQLRAAGCPRLSEQGAIPEDLFTNGSAHTIILTGCGLNQSRLQSMPGIDSYIERHTARADKAMSGGGGASTTLCQV